MQHLCYCYLFLFSFLILFSSKGSPTSYNQGTLLIIKALLLRWFVFKQSHYSTLCVNEAIALFHGGRKKYTLFLGISANGSENGKWRFRVRETEVLMFANVCDDGLFFAPAPICGVRPLRTIEGKALWLTGGNMQPCLSRSWKDQTLSSTKTLPSILRTHPYQ